MYVYKQVCRICKRREEKGYVTRHHTALGVMIVWKLLSEDRQEDAALENMPRWRVEFDKQLGPCFFAATYFFCGGGG